MDTKPLSPTVARATAISSAARPPYAVDRETHIFDLLNVVYKYRPIVVSVFLLVVIGTLVKTYTTLPMYRAT